MPSNYFSVSLAPSHVRWALVSADLIVLERGVWGWELSSAEQAVSTIAELVERHGTDVVALGVSVPATVFADDGQGTVYDGPLAPLDGVPLGAELSFATSLPVVVEGFGRACVLGEYVAGSLYGKDLAAALVVGDQVEGGIVSGGRVVRGAHSFAGTFGMLRRAPFVDDVQHVDDMSSLCGEKALRSLILEAKGMLDMGDIDTGTLFDWVMQGDEGALRGLHAYAKRLCMWICNLQCVIDPEVFAIGGAMASQPAFMEALGTMMRATMAEIALKPIPMPELVSFELGTDAALVGAAYVAKTRTTA